MKSIRKEYVIQTLFSMEIIGGGSTGEDIQKSVLWCNRINSNTKQNKTTQGCYEQFGL